MSGKSTKYQTSWKTRRSWLSCHKSDLFKSCCRACKDKLSTPQNGTKKVKQHERTVKLRRQLNMPELWKTCPSRYILHWIQMRNCIFPNQLWTVFWTSTIKQFVQRSFKLCMLLKQISLFHLLMVIQIIQTYASRLRNWLLNLGMSECMVRLWWDYNNSG